MSSNMQTRENRNRRERRQFLIAFALCYVLGLVVYLWINGAAIYARVKYQPQEGDVLFQSLPHSRLVDAIEGVTESPYSHCGIVAKRDNEWVVYEAIGDVRATPLHTFLVRGRNQGFAVYRLKPQFRKSIPETIQHVRRFLGRPYDVRYRMDDDSIYCSELVFKAYQRATGEELGQLVRLGDMNWQPYRETIEYYEGGLVPYDRLMITPKDLAKAKQLERVMSHQLTVENSRESM